MDWRTGVGHPHTFGVRNGTRKKKDTLAWELTVHIGCGAVRADPNTLLYINTSALPLHPLNCHSQQWRHQPQGSLHCPQRPRNSRLLWWQPKKMKNGSLPDSEGSWEHHIHVTAHSREIPAKRFPQTSTVTLGLSPMPRLYTSRGRLMSRESSWGVVCLLPLFSYLPHYKPHEEEFQDLICHFRFLRLSQAQPEGSRDIVN